MAVYVDKSRWLYAGEVMCHMLADTEFELHKMAALIGQPRSKYQKHASTPHYDINPERRQLAVHFGAVEIDRRRTVEIVRAIRLDPGRFFGRKQPAQGSFDFIQF